MKKIIAPLALFALLLTFAACEKKIDIFDNDTNYIQFDLPYVVDQWNRIIDPPQRVEALVYSFAMDDYTVTSYTFQVPVAIMGLPVSFDRPFKIEVVNNQTTAQAEDWDESALNNLVIKAGEMSTVVDVKVNRTAALKEGTREITFRIVKDGNNYFELGVDNSLTAKISFSDILIEPDWWPRFIRYFGEFNREVYAKWQEIYYLGADPNVDTYGNGQQLYWDNMPSSAVQSWYPSTFMFIQILKQYFMDNEVYPDGDTSKPRILLP